MQILYASALIWIKHNDQVSFGVDKAGSINTGVRVWKACYSQCIIK